MKTGPNVRSSKFLGLVNRKKRWGLSWRGRLTLAAALLALACGWMLEIQPFLAVTHRVDADYLVMEGWVHQFAANTTAGGFSTGHYQQYLHYWHAG